MKRRTAATALAAMLAAGIASAGDGAAPGLWGGVSYLGPQELASEIARREEDMARARIRIDELSASIAQAEKEIEDLSAQRLAQASRAREAIILHDRMARGGMLRIVLEAESFTDVAVLARMYSTMLKKEGGAFSDLEAKEDELLARKASLESDRAMLEKLESDLEEHKHDLEARHKTLTAID